MNRIWNLVSLFTAQRLYVRRRSAARTIYLTFDDGPHPEHTPALLEVLARHDAKATFFMLGDRVAKHSQIVRNVVAAGHTLGNHSYSHPSFVDISLREQIGEIDRTEALLAQIDGQSGHAVRPPRGRPTLGTIAMCLLGRYPLALWTHDSLDFRSQPHEVVTRLMGLDTRAGDILLFHDDSHVAAQSLEKLLPHWRHAGLQFSAL
jgi:peptidoglycan/xylan/chitin deacetylase (PgdA/CDA1 family)